MADPERRTPHVERCLRCGQSMADHWSHICPNCGRFFATKTGRQVAIQLGVSTLAAIAIVGGLVALLWQLA
jgi:ribosomal protein L32